MFKHLLVGVIAAAAMTATAIGAPSPAAKAPGANVMTCMIGPGQTWKLGSVQHAYNVQIGFTKASGGASTVQPGQCAFADRAIAASEPSQLCTSIDLESNSFSLHGTGGSPMDSSSTFSDGTKRGTLLQNAVTGAPETLTLNVEATANCFKITQILTPSS